MKFALLVAVACAVIGYVVFYTDLLEDKVDCPACQGTGRLLPDEDTCGTHKERSRLAEESEAREQCFTSQPCPYCKGAGRIGESKATEVPASSYTMDDLEGRSSGVLEEGAY